MAGAAGFAAFLDAVAIVADAFECPWAGAVTAFGDRSTDTEIGSKSVRSAIVYGHRGLAFDASGHPCLGAIPSADVDDRCVIAAAVLGSASLQGDLPAGFN